MAIRFNWLPSIDTEVTAEGFAVGRVNLLLARIFSIGGLAVGVQMLLNALNQSSLMNPPVFWAGFSAVLAGQVGLIYGAFFSGKTSFWFRWYSLSIAAVILTWPLGVAQVSDLPPDFYPWVWWGVGLAGISAVGGFSAIGAAVFLLSILGFWFIMRFTESFGRATLWLNVQDTGLVFLFTAVLGALIVVARNEANKVDLAASRKMAAAVEQARSDAAAIEKSRLDALVHDKVLTTLLLAARANTLEEQRQASQLASTAIAQLTEAPVVADGGDVSSSSFFAALDKVASAQISDVRVFINELAALTLTPGVANALTEATIQALLNSQQHAGQVSTRELHLRARQSGIKIVIKDDGRGFRMSRVPKNRMGIRVSIIDRVEAVGGRVFVDSKPGDGTNIVIEWAADR